jgi:methionine-rich copper-binding protein CopC
LASATAATLLAATLAPLMSMPAEAATAGMSAVDPQNGFPTWYSDGTTKLQLCYMAGAGCLAEPPDPTAPASYPDNFPGEAFWFNAEASGGNLGLYEAALEAAHLTDAVVPGEQIGFARLRFRINNLVAGQRYTITHPYGVNTFVAEAVQGGGGRINQTIDTGDCAPTPASPCDWAGVGEAFLGADAATTTTPFIRQVGAPAGTLGNINSPGPVTGAPSGTNAVIIEGPNAGGAGKNILTVSSFAVQGLIFNGADAAPSTPDLAAASDSGRSATDNITKATSPILTGVVPGMGPANEATVELVVDGAATAAASTTTLNGAYSLTPDLALTPGVHKVAARTPNPAYTLNPDGSPTNAAIPQFLTSTALTFTVDTTAPPVTIVAPFPSNPSADSTPTLNFAGASFECQLLPSNPDWDPTCVSPKSYDAQVDGPYTFNVRATDVAGNVSAPVSRAWTIGQPDTVAPTVSGHVPATNATNVATTTTLTATFSEAVTGVNDGTVSLKTAAGAAVPITVSYDAGTRVVSLNPTATLANSTTYTATLTGGATAIRDAAGNALPNTSWSFTTAPAPDTAAPTVSGRTPASGATNVAATGNVTATFSEAVTGVDGASFTLKNAAGTAVPATVSYNATTRVATLDPAASLLAGTSYTAALTGGATNIHDTAGNPLANTSWSFTTAPIANTAPTVTARTPAANALGASTTGNITATFSEAVQGISGTTFSLKNAAGTTIAGAVSYNATTRVATLNPTATLATDTKYTATLTGGSAAIRDTANLGLTTTSWTFTTGPIPTVSSRVPAANSTGRSQTANLTATFSENVTGLSGTTFTLKNGAGTLIPAAVSYNATTRVATLNPTTTLAADTKYTATLTGGSATAIRDLAGNRLTTTSWTFTTGPAPAISTRTPASGATAVSRTGNITATFSEGVTGVSGTSFVLRNATTGTAVTAVVTYNATTRVATLNPSVTLAATTRYTVTVTGSTTAVRDLGGNPLATSSWSFTTRA